MSNQTPELLRQQADTFLKDGRLLEARTLYEKVCALNENDADAWLMIGSIEGELGMVNEAVSHVRMSISIDPDYADAHHILARLLFSNSNIEDARNSLRKAVKLDPEYTEALVMLAGLEVQSENYLEAEICSRKAVQQDNSMIVAHMILGDALSSQGKFEESLVSYSTAIKLQPGLQSAWSSIGTIHLQLGEIDAAEDALNKALSLNPDDVHTQIYLLRILIERSQYSDAINQLRTMIKIDPANEELWQDMVIACVRSGKSDAWIEFCREIVSLHPECGEAWLGLGYALEHAEEKEEALESYQRAIDLAPHLHEAWSRKGTVCAALERNNESLESFREALARGSIAPVTHCGYGSMLRRIGLFHESEKHCRIATESAPEWPHGLCELGLILVEQGRLDEAVNVYVQAMALDVHSKDAAAGLSQVYERKGEPELAYEVIKPFLECGDTNSQIVCAFANLSVGLGRWEEALAQIDRFLMEEKLTDRHRSNLLFRAADIYNRQNEYDKAMKRYKEANALKRATFNSQRHARFISEMIDLFSEKALAQLPRSTLSSNFPVFIVGMPRSGTSLVEQILTCHDKIHGAGELGEISNSVSLLGFHVDKPVPSAAQLNVLSQNKLDRIANDYLTKLETLSSGKKRVTDKMPGNFLWLGLIQLLFPDARVIHTRRDPMDTCLSCYFTDFNGVHEYAYNLEHLGQYYCEYERIMKHWRRVLSIPMMEITYEKLVSNTEDVCREMIEFCGLEWDPKVLRFHESKRFTNTASYSQVRMPIYASSVGRGGKYKKHLSRLRSTLASCHQA